MRVLGVAEGLLTNVEVLDLLRERAGEPGRLATYPQPHDPCPTELQCYEALRASAAGAQERERVGSFIEHIRAIELTEAEILQVINLKPTSAAVVHAIVEDCSKRLNASEVEDLLALVEQFL